MIPTKEVLLEKAESLNIHPLAVEAFWDGDSKGWFVVLTLITSQWPWRGKKYVAHDICAMCGGSGDLRLFNGQVPPWPEAVRAKEVGEALSARFGVPFFFASPDHLEDSCPRWHERARGVPCQRCGILLLQEKSCPWRDGMFMGIKLTKIEAPDDNATHSYRKSHVDLRQCGPG